MKTVNISKRSAMLKSLLEQARQEDLILRAADGSEFILTAVDDFDLEVAQTRKNAALMSLLEARARQSKTIPLSEVKQRLGLTRNRRSSKLRTEQG